MRFDGTAGPSDTHVLSSGSRFVVLHPKGEIGRRLTASDNLILTFAAVSYAVAQRAPGR